MDGSSYPPTNLDPEIDLIAEGQRSPDIQAALIEGYLTPRRALMRQILERGIAAGQVRAVIDLSVTLDDLFGAIAGRALMWGRPLDLAWVDRLADTVFRGILVAPALGQAGPVAASA